MKWGHRLSLSPTLKRWVSGLLLLVLLLGLADGYKQLAWVKIDSDGKAVLSTGAPASPDLKPGQIVALRNGHYQALAQWRPPQDIEKLFTSTKARRVVFSHERHFAALGLKTCETCHADAKGLGQKIERPSLATATSLEPHSPTSLGRFCASCHDGKTSSAQIEAAKPAVSVKVFSAMGSQGGSCDRCHAPASHGSDFTAIHGEFAEDGGNCTACHRGGAVISQKQLGQALAFVSAQLTLVKDSENQAAFQKTLPNNFCAYCHSTDRELWQNKE